MSNTRQNIVLTPEEQRKFLTELLIHSDKAAIDFSRWAIQSLFFLSGAAAAALFARADAAFDAAAWPFIVSSAISVLAFGLAYIYQTCVTRIYDKILSGRQCIDRQLQFSWWARGIIIFLWLIGWISFAYGAWLIIKSLRV